MMPLLVKTILACGAALLLAQRLRQARASVRHLLFLATFGVLMMLPVISTLAPPMFLQLPLTVPSSRVLLDTAGQPSLSNRAVNGSTFAANRMGPGIPLPSPWLVAWACGVAVCGAPMAFSIL